MILESAILCLALNVYHEARSEMIPGQYAVAQVTMNRAGNESRVCKTVTAKHQFSWTTKMLTKKGKRFVLKKEGMPNDEVAWHKAKVIARFVLEHRPSDLTFGATHYHTVKIHPKWAKYADRTKRIGSHIFYKLA